MEQTPHKRGPQYRGIKFSPAVRHVAKAKKISQAHLARKAGCSTALVCRLFNGEMGCNPEIADAIAAELGMNREELMAS